MNQPGFRQFMLAMFFFTAGLQLVGAAQSWLVFHITGSSLALGAVTSLFSIVLFVFSPVAGAVADRVDRKLLIMLTWGVSGLVFAAVAGLVATERIQLWHLAIASAVTGGTLAFNLPARLSYISQLVGDARLTNAMALVSLMFNLNGIASPLIGGVMIDVIGAGAAFAVVAVLYFCGVVMVSLVPSRRMPARRMRTGILRDVVVGVRFVRGEGTVLLLLLIALAAIVLGQPYYVLLPDFAADTLHMPASGLGLLMAVVALGGLVGNLVVANLGPGASLGRWLLLLGGASGVALVYFAFTSSLYPGLAALFIVGITGLPVFTIIETLLQRVTPSEVRGRVLSLYMLTWGAQPAGLIVSSAMADAAGLRLPLILDGLAMLAVVGLVAWRRPSLARISVGGGAPRAAGAEPGSKPAR